MCKLLQRVGAALVLSFALAAPASATGFLADTASRWGDHGGLADIISRKHETPDADWWKRLVDWRKTSWEGPPKSDFFSHGSDRPWIGPWLAAWPFEHADFRERFRSYHEHRDHEPVSNGGVIPEPATALLLVAGLAVLAAQQRRR